MALLLGLVVLVLVLWAVGRFSTPDPKKNAALVRRIGGGAVLVFAGFLFFRGAMWVALPVAALGLGLVGWKAPLPGFNWLALKFPRRVSRVRSAFVEMELDDDTGAMRGWILAGPQQLLDQPNSAAVQKVPSISVVREARLKGFTLPRNGESQ